MKFLSDFIINILFSCLFLHLYFNDDYESPGKHYNLCLHPWGQLDDTTLNSYLGEGGGGGCLFS